MAEIDFHYKNVTDPIHGTISLSRLESDLISAQRFQRLHSIKQLGLGALVYPGANYSRFAHSVGACFLAGQMIDAINHNQTKKITDEEKQLYRLAGLFHDIGHPPFSHTFEHASADFYKSQKFLADEDNTEGNENASITYDHETTGRKIIELDPEIGSILSKHGLNGCCQTKANWSPNSRTISSLCAKLPPFSQSCGATYLECSPRI